MEKNRRTYSKSLVELRQKSKKTPIAATQRGRPVLPYTFDQVLANLLHINTTSS